MPDKINPPSLKEFKNAIWADFGARMSGAFSVPFGALAVFTDPKYGRYIWEVLALASIVFAIYRTWSNERRKVVGLAERLTPKIKLSCTDDKDCILYSPAWSLAPAKKITPHDPSTHFEKKEFGGYYVRVRIENDGEERLENLVAHLLNIQIRINGKFEDTSYSTNIKFDTNGKVVPKSVKEYINIFHIFEYDTRVELESDSLVHKGICDNPGFYKFDVLVSENSASKHISIGLDWHGVWERPTVVIL